MMLKRLKQAFRKKRSIENPVEVRIIPASEHRLSPASIPGIATDIVNRLESAGFSAYIVGGCVRDLLLNHQPKDFDIATNAKPEEIRGLFRRSRIIGRRFQIVHVLSGREAIEVTTFRSHHDTNPMLEPTSPRHPAAETSSRSKDGLLLRDNVFGTIDEDAQRRDFTANALYYHLTDNTIHDFTGGFADIQRAVLKVIGDPHLRYREDPVRMLRAARFVAKLGFALDPRSAEPIPQLSQLIRDIPSARLFDETLKLLMNGQSLATFTQLRELGLVAPLFPDTGDILAQTDTPALAFIEQALRNTDERVRTGKRVTPAFLLAALLWPAVRARAEALGAHGQPALTAIQDAAGQILSHQLRRIAIPRRFTLAIREIWGLQPRLMNRAGPNAQRLIANSKFRAGYYFLLLREQAGEDLGGLGDWWTRYQFADEEGRNSLIAAVKDTRPTNPSRHRRRSRKPRLTQ